MHFVWVSEDHCDLNGRSHQVRSRRKIRDAPGICGGQTDAHAKFTYPDGRSEDIQANAGSVQHMDAFSHLPESVSSKPFEVIQIELK